ncbi:hypothetical protein D9613_003877 [Agrocybe pediades]|uniref:DUF6534 domain-containing protein n=1 Tax=Agrocybe pediades TaxID=84607 RepID=A0A8H4QIF4_9AGAR|nr:hypothetical protein D9613_003877 [Agrocybe pediades]
MMLVAEENHVLPGVTANAIGYTLNGLLLGILAIQTHQYFLALPDDLLATRLLVLGVHFLEAAQSFLLMWSASHSLAAKFTGLIFLDETGSFQRCAPVLFSIVAFVARVFYAHRIKAVSQQSQYKKLVGFIVFLALVQLSSEVGTNIARKNGTFSTQLVEKAPVIVTSIIGALCDTGIAVCMGFHFGRQDPSRKEAVITLSKDVKLIAFGSLTGTVVAWLNVLLVIFPTYRPKLVMNTFGILSKLYSNSILALFNSRVKPISVSKPSRKDAATDSKFVESNQHHGSRPRFTDDANETHPLQ